MSKGKFNHLTHLLTYYFTTIATQLVVVNQAGHVAGFIRSDAAPRPPCCQP